MLGVLPAAGVGLFLRGIVESHCQVPGQALEWWGMKICAAQSVREAERALFASGAMSSLELMNCVVDRLESACRALPCWCGFVPSRVVVYAGTGNNAGDAIGLAARWGCPVTLRCVGRLSADAAAQCSGREVYDKPMPQEGLLILDGLLGSGAVGALRPEYAAMVLELNALRAASPRSLTLAIDIPTGLSPDSGACSGDFVRADVTAAIGCVKPGMLVDGAEDAVGRLLCIPLPEVGELPVADPACVADAVELPRLLPRRAYSCFKNRAGRVAIVAGSVGMAGAAQMCAEAALAAGAGLVVLYCLPPVYPVLAARVAAEVMVRPVGSYGDIDEPDAQVLVIGPGLGEIQPVAAGSLRALACGFRGTVVLDADGLNTAAAYGWSPQPGWVLTPHPGEMRRLDPRPAVPRREVVARYLAQHDCTLLLKGARSLVANRERALYNATGGPFMANGGQGDVLAGVIGALAAQGCGAFQAAAAAAYACGLAAERAWALAGYPPAVRATQVIGQLPAVLA